MHQRAEVEYVNTLSASVIFSDGRSEKLLAESLGYRFTFPPYVPPALTTRIESSSLPPFGSNRTTATPSAAHVPSAARVPAARIVSLFMVSFMCG